MSQRGGVERLFGHTKTFPALPGAPSFYAMSLRNKAFLMARALWPACGTARQRLSAGSRRCRLRSRTLIGKYSSLLFLDTTNRLHVYQLDDPHPESGLKALFGKVWYEGRTAGVYLAIYGRHGRRGTKAVAHPPDYRQPQGDGLCHAVCRSHRVAGGDLHVTVLRPGLACPDKADHGNHGVAAFCDSGISGSPMVGTTARNACTSFLLMLVCIPAAAFLFGSVWSTLPMGYRKWIKPGSEFLAFVPILVLVAYMAWCLGPVFDRLVFGDFRLWWPHVTGCEL